MRYKIGAEQLEVVPAMVHGAERPGRQEAVRGGSRDGCRSAPATRASPAHADPDRSSQRRRWHTSARRLRRRLAADYGS
jgi:hypothetical protein